eukprot:3893104-Rhodomonas_salina.3
MAAALWQGLKEGSVCMNVSTVTRKKERKKEKKKKERKKDRKKRKTVSAANTSAERKSVSIINGEGSAEQKTCACLAQEHF